MRLRRMRLTIAVLMTAVLYVAVLLWLLRDGHAVPSVGMAWFALTFVCWASVRGRRRPAGICFGASVIATNSLAAPVCFYYEGWVWTVAFIGLLGGMPMIFGFGAAWVGAAMRRDMDHSRPPFASWSPLLAIVIALSMAMTPVMTLLTFWPLRVAFLMSRPALERLADQVVAGTAPPLPNPGRTISHRRLRDGPRQWQRRLDHRPASQWSGRSRPIQTGDATRTTL
jgi:hypothetical protein